MELATEAETERFLQALWYRWGCCIVQEIAKAYSLSQEQKEALETVILKPNDWQIAIKKT